MTDYEHKRNDSSPWIRFDLGLWAPLTSGRSTIFIPRHNRLYIDGQSAEYSYIIRTGRVRVHTTLADGTDKQTYIGDVGAILGEISCIRGNPHSSSAVAVSDCEVYKIPYPQLLEQMQRNWSIAELVLNSVSRKAILLYSQVIELSFASAIQKTAITLLRLAGDYGIAVPGGRRISIKFTHEDISSLINVSRPTVSGIFSTLSSTGIIKKIGGYYVIFDIDGLVNLAEELESMK